MAPPKWKGTGRNVGVNSGGRVEHFYPVSMGIGALEWSVRTTLQFKIRDLLWAGAEASSTEGSPPATDPELDRDPPF